MGFKLKVNWKAKLITCLEIVKLTLLILMMTIGFFTSYAFIAFFFAVELTDVVLWICFLLACLSEFGYIRWISN